MKQSRFLLDAYGDRQVAVLLAMTDLSRDFLKLMALGCHGLSDYAPLGLYLWGLRRFYCFIPAKNMGELQDFCGRHRVYDDDNVA